MAHLPSSRLQSYRCDTDGGQMFFRILQLTHEVRVFLTRNTHEMLRKDYREILPVVKEYQDVHSIKADNDN